LVAPSPAQPERERERRQALFQRHARSAHGLEPEEAQHLLIDAVVKGEA
jgi:hypothetical protein